MSRGNLFLLTLDPPLVWEDYLGYKLIDDVGGHIFDTPLYFGTLATHDQHVNK